MNVILVQEQFVDDFGYPSFLVWLDILLTANVIIHPLLISHHSISFVLTTIDV